MHLDESKAMLCSVKKMFILLKFWYLQPVLSIVVDTKFRRYLEASILENAVTRTWLD